MEIATPKHCLDAACALEKQVRDLNDDLTFAKGDAVKTTLIQKQIEIAQAKVLAAA